MAAESAVHVAWIGLGSNLDGPAAHLSLALRELGQIDGCRRLAVSAFFDTEPVGGPRGQPLFCNACAVLATTLMPLPLLDRLQALEAGHGRVRDVRWGPRTLDLDLLAFDNLSMDSLRLTLPHPRAHERGFVLVPLAELSPALELGVHGRVADCLRCVGGEGVARRSTA
ncbi:MAG: 2-amino-4-hydroxy-6-hydroxymethyldihydropteridine diphosphokinase [Salinisphaera sp.]|nr:2-amino-4-hydroxy-6-hydroxymethyldihydropteridine diphosphokinase [Salinisphaera sp.]